MRVLIQTRAFPALELLPGELLVPIEEHLDDISAIYLKITSWRFRDISQAKSLRETARYTFKKSI